MNKEILQNAYSECLNMAHSHYENFPVASRLLPKHLRQPIAVIYAFARRADDFADEGNLSDFFSLSQHRRIRRSRVCEAPDSPIGKPSGAYLR